MAFLSICLNPTLQKTLTFSKIEEGRVNRAASQRLDASGKGVNVTRVLSQLGKKAIHLTHAGGALRGLFLELCKCDGLDVRAVESGSPVRFCYTVIKNDGLVPRSVTELVEEGEPVAPGTEESLLSVYKKILPEVDTVIFSGTKAKGYSGEAIPAMAEKARECGKKIILDIRGGDLLKCLPYYPDIIKPNLYEFAYTFVPELVEQYGELSGKEYGAKKSIDNAALELCAKYKTAIVLSRGSEELWHYAEGRSGIFPVDKVEPVNTIGSGDAFTAGFAAASADGASLEAALAEGARCGRLNALHIRPGVIW